MMTGPPTPEGSCSTTVRDPLNVSSPVLAADGYTLSRGRTDCGRSRQESLSHAERVVRRRGAEHDLFLEHGPQRGDGSGSGSGSGAGTGTGPTDGLSAAQFFGGHYLIQGDGGAVAAT